MEDDKPFAQSLSVAQASGMVSVQAHCTLDEAVDLMKQRAEASDRTLEELAEAVINRTVRFGE